jgi:methanogenic corrinoid protein MtbC1
MADYEGIKINLGDLNEDNVLEAIKRIVDEGGDAEAALESCQKGLEIVGGRFDSGEYFIGDLIYAGEIMREAMDILRPALVSDSGEATGKVLICTVEGDIHDIGKNIVISLLEAGGFEVVDLGVDVSPEKVVQVVRESGIRIVALSGVLTLAIESMKKTVNALKEAGLRDTINILLGGAPVTAKVCEIVGADAWSLNPQEGLRICRNWAAG